MNQAADSIQEMALMTTDKLPVSGWLSRGYFRSRAPEQFRKKIGEVTYIFAKSR